MQLWRRGSSFYKGLVSRELTLGLLVSNWRQVKLLTQASAAGQRVGTGAEMRRVLQELRHRRGDWQKSSVTAGFCGQQV